MNYKIRPGFVMIKICDTHLLVAKRELWDKYNRVRPVPVKYALCWNLMAQGKSSDEVIQSVCKLFNKSEDEISRKFSPIFQKLADDGYLIPA